MKSGLITSALWLVLSVVILSFAAFQADAEDECCVEVSETPNSTPNGEDFVSDCFLCEDCDCDGDTETIDDCCMYRFRIENDTSWAFSWYTHTVKPAGTCQGYSYDIDCGECILHYHVNYPAGSGFPDPTVERCEEVCCCIAAYTAKHLACIALFEDPENEFWKRPDENQPYRIDLVKDCCPDCDKPD